MCSVATRLFYLRDSDRARLPRRGVLRDASRITARPRAPVAPRPRHREDDDEHAGAGDDERRRRRAGGGRRVFPSRLDPGVFSSAPEEPLRVRRGHRRPVPRRVRVLEGDNARRKRGGGRQPGQGRPDRISVSARERGARCRRRERRVRAAATTHGVGPLAERRGPRRRPRGGERGDDARTRARAPRAWRGSRPRGGRAQERPRRVRRSRPFGPSARARSSTGSGAEPRRLRCSEACVPATRPGSRGRTGRDAPSRAARRHRGRSRRGGSCDALGARRASRGEKESA